MTKNKSKDELRYVASNVLGLIQLMMALYLAWMVFSGVLAARGGTSKDLVEPWSLLVNPWFLAVEPFVALILFLGSLGILAWGEPAEPLGPLGDLCILTEGRTYHVLCQSKGVAIVHENFTARDLAIKIPDEPLPERFLYEKKWNDKGEDEFVFTSLA